MAKMIDKKYLTLAIVFILTSTLLLSGCFGSGEQQYSKGEIEVVFKENVTKEEAGNVVESFDNCSVDSWSKSMGGQWVAIINVPEGEEKKYVRLFENQPEVDFASRVEIAG